MVLDSGTIFPTADKGADEFFIQEAEKALQPRIVVKTANETSTSTTLKDDPELLMNVSADSIYYFKVSLQASVSLSSKNIDFTLKGPTGAVGRLWLTVNNGDLTTTKDVVALESEVTGEIGNPEETNEAEGWIKTGNTAGDLQVRWGLNLSGATLTVYANSYLEVTRQ